MGGVVTTHPFVQKFHLKQNSTAGGLYQNLSIDGSFTLFPPNIYATLQKDQTTHHRKDDLKSAYSYLFQKFSILCTLKKCNGKSMHL